MAPDIEHSVIVTDPISDRQGNGDWDGGKPGRQSGHDKDAAETLGGGDDPRVDVRVGNPQFGEIPDNKFDVLEFSQPYLKQLPEEIDPDQE